MQALFQPPVVLTNLLVPALSSLRAWDVTLGPFSVVNYNWLLTQVSREEHTLGLNRTLLLFFFLLLGARGGSVQPYRFAPENTKCLVVLSFCYIE